MHNSIYKGVKLNARNNPGGRPNKPKSRSKSTPRAKAKSRPKSKPTGVGDILGTLKATTDLGKHLEQAQIWTRWPEMVGQQLCAHCRPQTIKDQQLRVEADSAVWMHKVSYRKWEIVKRINRIAQKELISDIFVVLVADHEKIDD